MFGFFNFFLINKLFFMVWVKVIIIVNVIKLNKVIINYNFNGFNNYYRDFRVKIQGFMDIITIIGYINVIKYYYLFMVNYYIINRGFIT